MSFGPISKNKLGYSIDIVKYSNNYCNAVI